MIRMRLQGASVRGAAFVVAMACALVGASAPAAQGAQDDRDAVLAANAAFYAALNALFTGDVAPMTAVWSHAEDVTYMGPTGKFEKGWSAVLVDWEGQAAMKLGGHVEPADVHVVVGHDLAIVSGYEQGENTNAQGQVERVQLRATNLYRKEAGQWKMIGHHTDLLPYLAQ